MDNEPRQESLPDRRTTTRAELDSLLQPKPTGQSDVVALDAAIRGALERSGPDRGRTAEELRSSHPELRQAIDRAMWLDEVFSAFDLSSIGKTPAVPTEMPDELGTALEDGRLRYKVKSLLGKGTRAGVYLAEDRLLSDGDRPALVAIKLLADTSAEGSRRALREARRMRLVDHPGVVRVLDVCAHEGQPAFIVQEYVEGETFESWLAARGNRYGRTRAGRRRVVGLIAELADGVQALHAVGLAHRDLSPRNVLIDSQGRVRLTDFGSVDGAFAPQTCDDESPDGASGAGTLAFLAPERLLEPDGDPLPASDVFSLGSMLFWSLTGRSVYGEKPAEAIRVCSSPEREIPGIEDALKSAGVSCELRAVTARASAFGFAERHGTAASLAEDLRRWLEHKPLRWNRSCFGRRALLFVRRKPFGTAAVLVLLGALGMTAAASIEADRLGDEALERAHEAALAQQKLETEREWKQKTARSLGRLLSSFATAKQQGLEAEVLTSLWILEWSHGPTLLNDPVSLAPIWSRRVETLEEMRARLAGDAGQGTIASRLIEPSLGLWRLRSGDPEGALSVLGPSLDYWSGVCGPDDPWIANLETMHAVALIQRSRATGEAPDPTVLYELRRLLDTQGPAIEAPIRELASSIVDAS